MTEPLDLLAVMAHPDDAELLCGGLLIKSVDEGLRVGVLDLTRGELGSKGTAEIRAKEAEAAAAVMGLTVRRNAGLPDAGIRSDSPEARRVVVEHLRALRPGVVVTHARHGRHPDHREAARLTYDACYLAGLTNYPAAGQRHRPVTLLHATAFREDAPPPTLVVDITAWMDRKIEALAAYASQFEGATAMGEVYPGGDRPLFDQIRAHHARDGARIRVAYGEPYRLRHALELRSVTELGISAF